MTAIVTIRGVTYSASVLPEPGTASLGRVELAVNGVAMARGDLSVRIDGPMLGGDERSATAIYTALERELVRMLSSGPT